MRNWSEVICIHPLKWFIRRLSLVVQLRRWLLRGTLWGQCGLATGRSARVRVSFADWWLIAVGIMMRLKRRWLRRRCTEGWIRGPLELCNRIRLVVGCLGCCIVDISPAEVDVLGWIWYFLTSALFLNEVGDLIFDLEFFQRETNSLTGLFSC